MSDDNTSYVLLGVTVFLANLAALVVGVWVAVWHTERKAPEIAADMADEVTEALPMDVLSMFGGFMGGGSSESGGALPTDINGTTASEILDERGPSDRDQYLDDESTDD